MSLLVFVVCVSSCEKLGWWVVGRSRSSICFAPASLEGSGQFLTTLAKRIVISSNKWTHSKTSEIHQPSSSVSNEWICLVCWRINRREMTGTKAWTQLQNDNWFAREASEYRARTMNLSNPLLCVPSACVSVVTVTVPSLYCQVLLLLILELGAQPAWPASSSRFTPEVQFRVQSGPLPALRPLPPPPPAADSVLQQHVQYQKLSFSHQQLFP